MLSPISNVSEANSRSSKARIRGDIETKNREGDAFIDFYFKNSEDYIS